MALSVQRIDGRTNFEHLQVNAFFIEIVDNHGMNLSKLAAILFPLKMRTTSIQSIDNLQNDRITKRSIMINNTVLPIKKENKNI